MIISDAMRNVIEEVRAGDFPEAAKMLVDIIDKLEAENLRLLQRLNIEDAVTEAAKRGDIE